MKSKTRYYLNLFFVTTISLLFALLLLTIYFTDKWTQSILHPTRIPSTGDLLKAEHVPFRKVKLTTKDGLELAAWYTVPKNGAVILLAHGYNDKRPENIYMMLVWHGYGVLTWDFRAHGDSGGDISTLGYYEQLDVEAALDYALAQEGVEHVGAWGGSMGASTVILTAARRTEIEAVMSDSAYPSLEDIFSVNVPYDFLIPIVKASGEYHSGAGVDDVRPVDEIGKISPRPVFIIDGWEGAAIIMNSPYRLYDSANEPKQIWVEEGVPHLGMLANNSKKYENRMIEFFDEWLLGK
ncbi:MAG: alpha/beta fold hydrolase [Anaerolineales bacterium]|nr:alpha/beta fold hydrolase [Anaerolineales bacterium]